MGAIHERDYDDGLDLAKHVFQRGLSQGQHLRLFDYADLEHSVFPGLPGSIHAAEARFIREHDCAAVAGAKRQPVWLSLQRQGSGFFKNILRPKVPLRTRHQLGPAVSVQEVINDLAPELS